MTNVSANMPEATTPIIGADGRINPIWWQYLLRLFARTGGGVGIDSAAVAQLAQDNAAMAAAQGVAAARTLLEILQHSQVAIPRKHDHHDAPVERCRCRCTCQAPAYSHGIHDDPDLHALATPTAAGFMSAADKAKLDLL